MCGVLVDVPPAGRPPKYCPDHRKKTGTLRDVDGARHRKNARQNAKRGAGVKRAEAAAELEDARRLAIGLIGHPTDDATAARAMGLSVTPATLKKLRRIADKHFPGIIEGDLETFGTSCLMTLHTIVAEVGRAALAAEIGPRDLPHAGRAVGHIMAMVCGDNVQARYSEITLVVAGADGKKFNPAEVEQVAS